MPHDAPLITTMAAAFASAWLLGVIAQRIGLSPIVIVLVAIPALGMGGDAALDPLERAERQRDRVNQQTAGAVAQSPPRAVVVGYGPVGQSVDQSLRAAGLETVIAT
jgi:hypothetical protein